MSLCFLSTLSPSLSRLCYFIIKGVRRGEYVILCFATPVTIKATPSFSDTLLKMNEDM